MQEQGTRWGGATLPGSPLATLPPREPSHALPAPRSTRAVPQGGRGEGRRDGEPLVGAEPKAGLGGRGLRLARPLPGTPRA